MLLRDRLVEGAHLRGGGGLRKPPMGLCGFLVIIGGESIVREEVVAQLCRRMVLVAVLAYTLARKDLGREHAPRFAGARQALLASAIGVAVGFYDGFFGPGTGSFFVFLFVRALGFDFLHASASAKLLNTATNAAALLLLGLAGHVWWHVPAVLAVANVVGSLVGTRLALRHGAGFVRVAFLLVVAALIAKTGWDAFLR